MEKTKTLRAATLALCLGICSAASSQGITDWRKFWNAGAGTSSKAEFLTRDASGNTIIAGRTSNGSYWDLLVQQYNAAGVLQWSQSYRPFDTNWPTAIATDAAGNIFVAGIGYQVFTGASFGFVKKLTPTGVEQWQAQHGKGTASLFVEPSGEVLVCGTINVEFQANNLLLKKLSLAGKLVWQTIYNSGGTNQDTGISVSEDSAGNIYALMNTSGALQSQRVLQFSAAGNLLWKNSYFAPGNGSSSGTQILGRPAGGCVVLGSKFDGSNTNTQDITLSSFDTSGLLLWRKIYDNGDSTSDTPVAMSMNAAGKVAFVASTLNVWNFPEIATALYDTSGAKVFARTRGNGTTTGATASGVALDDSDNVFSTGKIYLNSNWHASVFKYNSVGTLVWANSYNTVSGDDAANGVTIDNLGNAYVVGSCTRAASPAILDLMFYKIH